MIDVIGFAVGQHQHKVLAVGLFGQFCRCMANGSADTGVIARFQRGDTAAHGMVHRLVECLDGFHPHPVATPRGKCQDGVVVATGGEPLGQHH
ncbi:hypothetical protein D3C80_1767640 [compost metagenome]